jgi:hypothetical protein
MTERSNSGQALVLILLVMAVAMTVVLSVVSRSISDVSVTTQEEESLRAFSAAEAGVEEVLISNLAEGTQPPKVVSGEGTPAVVQYQANVSGLSEGASEYFYPFEVKSGDTATIWFVSHDADGNLLPCSSGTCFNGPQVQVCWGKMEGTSNIPAVEVSLWYVDGATSKIVSAQTLYDPAPKADQRSGTSRQGNNPTSCRINSDTGVQNLKYSRTIDFQSDFGLSLPERQNGMKLLKVKMLYSLQEPQTLGIRVIGGGGNFPSQGRTIESTGSAGESARKIKVYLLYPDFPSIFDSAVLSTNSIAK